jgi:purine-binding chemotaxis protein CheW
MEENSMNRKETLETALEGLFSPQNEPLAADSPPKSPSSTRTPVAKRVEEAAGVENTAAAAAEEQATVSFTQPEGTTPSSDSPDATGQHEAQIVTFTLAGEHYGVDVSTVNSIIKMQYITAIPRAPRFIEGVTNLRGTVLPVVDLRKRFGMPPAEDEKNARIVVVEIRDTMIGIIVDEVDEVLHVPAGDIEPPSPIVTTIDSAFITGVAKAPEREGVSGRLIILLDLGAALSVEKRSKLVLRTWK